MSNITVDVIDNESKQTLTFTQEEVAKILREKAAQIWNKDTKYCPCVFYTHYSN